MAALMAGGEEMFAPPAEIDHDSLARFAAWCRALRALEKPGQQSIAALARDGDAVGTPMHVKEVVAGTVLRCIKHSAGAKRYAYWCLLDKMAKDYRSTFAFLFEQHLADVAADCIEWEDAALAAKYERLLQHWDAVFDRALVEQLLTLRRQERLWSAQHPEDAKRMRAEEEAVWDREIAHSADADGLDTYGEPCHEYLKGQCPWKDGCKQLHPPGLEGSLPPESRLGDWRCPGCGMINRHFRRRCFACVREKPQYKKGQVAMDQAPEVAAVKRADADFLAPLSQQFGYDPNDEAAAVRHWRERLATPAQVAQYIEDRRRRYQSEIIPHFAALRRDRAGRAGAANNGSDEDDDERGEDAAVQQQQRRPLNAAAAAAAAGTKTIEISAPAAALTGSAFDRMVAITSAILVEGSNAADFAKSVFLLSKVLAELAAENRAKHGCSAQSPMPCANADASLVLFDTCRLIHTAWVATGRKRPHLAILFLGGIVKDLDALPLSAEHRAHIGSLAQQVAA